MHGKLVSLPSQGDKFIPSIAALLNAELFMQPTVRVGSHPKCSMDEGFQACFYDRMDACMQTWLSLLPSVCVGTN